MLKASGYTWIAGGVIVAGALLFVGARRAAGNAGNALQSTLQAAGDMINPASPANIFNQAVIAAGQVATGSADWTLGGALYDWLHPFEGYQITGNPAALPWYARPAGYGVEWGRQSAARSADFQLSDLIAP